MRVFAIALCVVAALLVIGGCHSIVGGSKAEPGCHGGVCTPPSDGWEPAPPMACPTASDDLCTLFLALWVKVRLWVGLVAIFALGFVTGRLTKRC